MSDSEKILEFDKVMAQLEAFTSSSLGLQHLSAIFYYHDFQQWQTARDQTAEALALVNAYGALSLGGLTDLTQAVRKAGMDGILSGEELLNCAAMDDVVQSCRQYAAQNKLETPYFTAAIKDLTDLRDLKQVITLKILPDGEIADHASPKLWQIRRKMIQTKQKIQQTLNRYLEKGDDYLAEQWTTMRNDRYVIPVKSAYVHQVKGIVHAQSASKQTVYIEPEAVVSLNNELTALQAEEFEEIQAILFDCSQLVKKNQEPLLKNQEILGTWDFLFAKGRYAKSMRGVMADLVPQGREFVLKKARHPLLPSETVVANDIIFRDPRHMLLVTGSNTGGKTVTLKTAGLLTLMSHYALPVPADAATLPFFDAVYVDLGDEQSLEQSLSTFSGHLSKLVAILAEVTKDSLVLVDEIGSGTDPLEGQSLARAVLEYLHEFQTMTIATTHYSSLKRFARESDYILTASVSFDHATLTPTYQLLLGQAGSSYALEISRRLGLPERILRRADELISAERSDTDRLLIKLEQEQEENLLLKQKLNEELTQAQEQKKQYEQANEQWEQEKAKMKQQAEEEFQTALTKAQAELENIIASFKEKNELKIHEQNEARQALAKFQADKTVRQGDPDYPYQTGDIVRVVSMNRVGEVLAVKADALLLDIDGMKVRISKSDAVYEGKKEPEKKVATRGQIPKKTGSFEINIIGMRYEEAMRTVDKFLDDAIVMGYPAVRIIHGVGTGALRNGVNALLKKNKMVKSFHSAGPQDGGLGVTLANFKE